MSKNLNADWAIYQGAYQHRLGPGEKDLFASGWMAAQGRHRQIVDELRIKLNELALDAVSQDAAKMHQAAIDLLLEARQL